MLEPLSSDPVRAGLFLDFDGTLSEIAPTPEEARAAARVSETLTALAARYRVVAIVSGRPAEEVAALAGAEPPVRVFGLYGLEERGREGGEGIPVAEVLPEAERAAALVPGARVEHKGRQIAVHYRGAADAEAAARVLRERLAHVAERHGLRVLEGKRVLELAPADAPTKGDVVRRVAAAEELSAILYAGDDVADLEAFAAVEDLRGGGTAGVTVAVRSAEGPGELLERADLVVDGPAGLLELLSGL